MDFEIFSISKYYTNLTVTHGLEMDIENSKPECPFKSMTSYKYTQLTHRFHSKSTECSGFAVFCQT